MYLLIRRRLCAIKGMVDPGWSRRDVIDYIVEYCRRPASEVPLEWLIENNHSNWDKLVNKYKDIVPEYADY